MPKPAQFDDWPTQGKIPYGPYMAVVERIVDGDTLYVFIDPGLNVYPYHSIRLADVDAPELFTGDSIERDKGRKARAYLEALLPVGTQIILNTDRDRTTFGRYIGWLTRVSDGLDVNGVLTDWLTEQGF